MAKAFSVASWNVEHFGDDPSKVNGIVNYMADQEADIVVSLRGKSPLASLHLLLSLRSRLPLP